MALRRFTPFQFDDEFFFHPTPFFALSNREEQEGKNKSLWMRSQDYNIQQDDKTYSISIDVPGVKTGDMTMKLDEKNGRTFLCVSGGRKMKTENSVSEHKFSERFLLSDDVDTSKITANLSDGVLQVNAPKKEPQKPESRVITIVQGPAEEPQPMEQEEKKED